MLVIGHILMLSHFAHAGHCHKFATFLEKKVCCLTFKNNWSYYNVVFAYHFQLFLRSWFQAGDFLGLSQVEDKTKLFMFLTSTLSLKMNGLTVSSNKMAT